MKRESNTADVLSPLNGVIVEVNSKVRENPKVANREPYEEGWLFVVRTQDVKGSVKELMSDADSINWIDQEVHQLERMIEDVAGPMTVDGGFLGEDIFGHLPDLGWRNLTKTFLKT